jgi:hypothetical protein
VVAFPGVQPEATFSLDFRVAFPEASAPAPDGTKASAGHMPGALGRLTLFDRHAEPVVEGGSQFHPVAIYRVRAGMTTSPPMPVGDDANIVCFNPESVDGFTYVAGWS